MNATSWIFRRLTQNEFKAITDQIQSEGGGSQTYIDLPKGKITDDNLTSFFGEGTPLDKGYKWGVPIHSLSLDMQPQEITISQRRDLSNCIREQNKDKRINIWKSEYSDFPKDSYNESENPIYIFILKSDEENFYAGWFYAKDYEDKWFLTMDLCKPFLGEPCGFAVFNTPIAFDFYNYRWPFISLSHDQFIPKQTSPNKSRQVIYFGAPGTGKSFTIDNMADDEHSVRTTFHPDSDYASFVGAYKPTMEDVPMSAFVGKEVHIAQPQGGHSGVERKIVYKYVPQAFLKAYVAAWKDLDNPYFLIIEEINRGNCAQIFGDLFQLLDRNNAGCSSYAIHADDDICQFLATDKNGFADLTEGQEQTIREYKLEKDNGRTQHLGQDILSGKLLLLPPNLYIWATMNTSDQSLFPIDSAFKRRWDWKFIPIDYNPIDKKTGQPIDWKFRIGDNLYSWGQFLSIINPEIYTLTESSDKQMGYFFVKADRSTGIIAEDVFLNKVLFYLWTDVFKDFDVSSELFKNKKANRSFRFTDFFEDPEALENFIANFNLDIISSDEVEDEESGDELDNEESNSGVTGRFKLIIKFPDGRTFQGKTQFDSYLMALEAIGLDKCEPIAATKKYKRHDSPLIAKEKSEDILADKTYSYVHSGDYYVVKGIDTKTQRSFLYQVSNELGLGLVIEVIRE